MTDILIIGAGPAGLLLAHLLQAKGISTRLFERDGAINTRSSGWAVALGESLHRLRDVLPTNLGDIYSTSVNASTGRIDTGVVLEAFTGDRIGQIGGPAKWQPGSMLRVKRQSLRHYLQKGLNIEYGKEFEAYCEDEYGVTAHFKDGTKAQGSILVGADGASSRVRWQLLNKRAETAAYIPIVGTFRFSREELVEFQKTASALFIACAPDLRLLTGLLDTEPDESAASAYYAVCYKSPTPEKDSDKLESATKQELYDLALNMTSHLDNALTKVIRKAGVDGIVKPSLRFREFSPPANFPSGRVTVMGDAAHTMMPFRGAGANTALLDACDFASLFTNPDILPSRDQVIALLQLYSQIVCPRGNKVVAATRISGDDMYKVLGVDTYQSAHI